MASEAGRTRWGMSKPAMESGKGGASQRKHVVAGSSRSSTHAEVVDAELAIAALDRDYVIGVADLVVHLVDQPAQTDRRGGFLLTLACCGLSGNLKPGRGGEHANGTRGRQRTGRGVMRASPQH